MIDPLHWAKTHRKHTTLIIQIAFLTFLALLVALMFLGTTSTAVAEMDTWKPSPIPLKAEPKDPCGLDVVICPQEAVAGRVEPVAKPQGSIEARIRAIAAEMNLAQWQTDRAVRIAKCESGLNPNAHGDSGRSHGVWQIFQPAHPDITEAQAKDVEWSTRWSLNMMKEGYWHLWTCSKYVS